MVTVIWWSPMAWPRTSGRPRPRRVKILPGWVPAGIFSGTSPRRVGTWTSPPSAAIWKGMGISQWVSRPSRENRSWGRTCSTTNKSPAGPPREPPSPLPDRRRREPVSTPAGMFSSILRATLMRPSPPHLRQGWRMISPVPPQWGQGWRTWKNPLELTTMPRPPHLEQVSRLLFPSAPVPLQASQSSTMFSVSSRLEPKAASSKSISRS